MEAWAAADFVIVRCENCGLEQTTRPTSPDADEWATTGCVVCGHLYATAA